jgi:hypothetical protein
MNWIIKKEDPSVSGGILAIFEPFIREKASAQSVLVLMPMKYEV